MMLKKFISVVMVLGILFCLAGCAAGQNTGSTQKGETVGEMAPQEDTDAGLPDESLNLDNEALENRKLIKDVSLEIQTKTYDGFMDNLESALAEQGGYVQQSDMRGGTGEKSRRSATIVVRIPADKLAAFLDGVSSQGVITSQSETVKDVTMEYVDTESRLEALRSEQTALLALLEKAGSLQDILTVQDRLTEVRGEIESYEARLRTMETLVANSTVTLRVYEVEKEPEAEEKGLWQEISHGFMNSLSSMGQGLRTIFVWFMSALPYLLLLAVVACAVLLIVRLTVRRTSGKRPKSLSGTPTVPFSDAKGRAEGPESPENRQL